MKQDDIAHSMKCIAERSAQRLDTHFQELNTFVSHGGEIGRAHEYILREALKPFTPPKFRIGTGFFVRPTLGTSPQQDIMIFENHNLPTLFEMGDCVVVDWQAVAACIEVKTTLKSEQKDGEDLLFAMLGKLRNFPCSTIIFAWKGISLEKIWEKIWEYFDSPIDELVKKYNTSFPAIYVRSQYILLPHHDGDIKSPPFEFYEIKKPDEQAQTNKTKTYINDGEALIILLYQIWYGINRNRYGIDIPEWLSQAVESLQPELKPWRKDLQHKIDEHYPEG